MSTENKDCSVTTSSYLFVHTLFLPVNHSILKVTQDYVGVFSTPTFVNHSDKILYYSESMCLRNLSIVRNYNNLENNVSETGSVQNDNLSSLYSYYFQRSEIRISVSAIGSSGWISVIISISTRPR
jgi:hypothetical protein